jgi:hypothetical protein
VDPANTYSTGMRRIPYTVISLKQMRLPYLLMESVASNVNTYATEADSLYSYQLRTDVASLFVNGVSGSCQYILDRHDSDP